MLAEPFSHHHPTRSSVSSLGSDQSVIASEQARRSPGFPFTGVVVLLVLLGFGHEFGIVLVSCFLIIEGGLGEERRMVEVTG